MSDALVGFGSLGVLVAVVVAFSIHLAFGVASSTGGSFEGLHLPLSFRDLGLELSKLLFRVFRGFLRRVLRLHGGGRGNHGRSWWLWLGGCLLLDCWLLLMGYRRLSGNDGLRRRLRMSLLLWYRCSHRLSNGWGNALCEPASSSHGGTTAETSHGLVHRGSLPQSPFALIRDFLHLHLLLLLQLLLLLLEMLLLVEIHHEGRLLNFIKKIHVVQLEHFVVLVRIDTKATHAPGAHPPGSGTRGCSYAAQASSHHIGEAVLLVANCSATDGAVGLLV